MVAARCAEACEDVIGYLQRISLTSGSTVREG
jgi:hypothetical protein